MNNWEYATFIYAVYWNTPRGTVFAGFSYYEPWTDKKQASVGISLKYNTKNYSLVAIVHTHGAYKKGYDNENFSGESGDKGVAKTFKLMMYVVTPGGALKMYNYITKKVITLSYKTYHDYRSKMGFLWMRHRCSKCVN